jgi:hypothetical protein
VQQQQQWQQWQQWQQQYHQQQQTMLRVAQGQRHPNTAKVTAIHFWLAVLDHHASLA